MAKPIKVAATFEVGTVAGYEPYPGVVVLANGVVITRESMEGKFGARPHALPRPVVIDVSREQMDRAKVLHDGLNRVS